MKLLVFFLALFLLLNSCDQGYIAPPVQFEDTGYEELNNKYDSKIVEKQAEVEGDPVVMYDIEYEIEGEAYRNYYSPEFEPALNWIIENTPEDVRFFNWWDYGHMIRGYTGRDVVVYSPSESILWSIASGEWSEEDSGKFASENTTADVITALTTSDIGETLQIMDKYNSSYIFVTVNDFEMLKFVTGEELNGAMIIYLIAREELEGLELVYDDQIVRVYRRN